VKENLPKFIPSINPTSDEMVKRSQNGAGESRWKVLYEMGEKKKVEMEQKRKQFKDEQEKKEQFSFRPNVSNAKTERRKEDIVARTAKWVKERELKAKAIKEEREKKELESCSFKPKLYVTNTHTEEQASSSNESNYKSLRSIDKYIEKQRILREQKEEMKKKAAHKPGSGNVWTGKGITVPKAPNFSSRERVGSVSGRRESTKRHQMYPKSEIQNESMKINKEIESIVSISIILGY